MDAVDWYFDAPTNEAMVPVVICIFTEVAGQPPSVLHLLRLLEVWSRSTESVARGAFVNFPAVGAPETENASHALIQGPTDTECPLNAT